MEHRRRSEKRPASRLCECEQRRVYKPGDSRLTDPPESERCQSDPELGCRDVSVQIVQDCEQAAGRATAGGGESFDTRFSHRNKRKLRRDKEAVRKNECYHEKNIKNGHRGRRCVGSDSFGCEK